MSVGDERVLAAGQKEGQSATGAAPTRSGATRRRYAEALRAAHRQNTDLDLTGTAGRDWVLALSHLLGHGEVAVAVHTAPLLRQAYPRVAYLEFIDYVLRVMPPGLDEPARQFVDDLDEDVQIVERPGSAHVVFAFCGSRHHFGLPLPVMHRWFAQLDAHIVYLRDRYNVGYARGIPPLGAGLGSTATRLTAIAKDLGARHVGCVGNSSGGSGALRYGGVLGADRILALAPITTADRLTKELSKELQPNGPLAVRALPVLYRDGVLRARARVLYGADNDFDRTEAMRMVGLPNVTVESIPGIDSHHVIPGLIRARQLLHVLRWLTAAEDHIDFAEVTTADANAPAAPGPAAEGGTAEEDPWTEVDLALDPADDDDPAQPRVDPATALADG